LPQVPVALGQGASQLWQLPSQSIGLSDSFDFFIPSYHSLKASVSLGHIYFSRLLAVKLSNFLGRKSLWELNCCSGLFFFSCNSKTRNFLPLNYWYQTNLVSGVVYMF